MTISFHNGKLNFNLISPISLLNNSKVNTACIRFAINTYTIGFTSGLYINIKNELETCSACEGQYPTKNQVKKILIKMPPTFTNAYFRGRSSRRNLAKGIVVKASNAITKMLIYTIAGTSVNPTTPAKESRASHSNVVNNKVENTNEIAEVLY